MIVFAGIVFTVYVKTCDIYSVYRCIRQATDVLKAPRGTVGSLVPLVVQSLVRKYTFIYLNAKTINILVTIIKSKISEVKRKIFISHQKY